MTAKHKFQNAALVVRTSLPADRLVHLAAAAGEAVANRVPGQARVEVEETYPMSVTFAVKSLGGISVPMRFRFDIVADGAGVRGTSQITAFRTSQPKYMFIPIGPKRLLGWAQYRKFTESLAAAVRAEDAAAHCEFSERPTAPVR